MKQILEMLRQLRVGLSLDIDDAYCLSQSDNEPEVCMVLQNTADIARKGHRVGAGELIESILVGQVKDVTFKVEVSRNARLLDYGETVYDHGSYLTLVFATDGDEKETRTFKADHQRCVTQDSYYVGFLHDGRILLEVRQ